MRKSKNPIYSKIREAEEKEIRRLLHDSVLHIEASDRMKRQIDERISEELIKEETKMKHFNMKKITVGLAAACFLIGMVSIAGSNKKYTVSSTSGSPDYTAFGDLEKAEETAGYEIKAVEKFSNGFGFQGITIADGYLNNEQGQKEEARKEIYLQYEKDGERITFFTHKPYAYEDVMMENGENLSGGEYADTLQVGDVQVGFRQITNKFVPPDYELTAEDEKNMEDPDFNLAYGSSEIIINTGYSVSWMEDGISYSLYGTDLSISGDEMLEMAKEIIENGN